MGHVVFCSPLHVMPQQIEMPTLQDDKGGGARALRRRWQRGLSRWELDVPGRQELLDPILGLLEYAQGDTDIWFDGAGFGEVTSPVLIGFGDNVTTDYLLPHKHVYCSSLIVYINGGVWSDWAPLDYDGVALCSGIRFGTSIGPDYPITAVYRRDIRCQLVTEDKPERQRQFRSTSATDSIYGLKFYLQESA